MRPSAFGRLDQRLGSWSAATEGVRSPALLPAEVGVTPCTGAEELPGVGADESSGSDELWREMESVKECLGLKGGRELGKAVNGNHELSK